VTRKGAGVTRGPTRRCKTTSMRFRSVSPVLGTGEHSLNSLSSRNRQVCLGGVPLLIQTP
jgi:hypothetical protein